MGQPLAVLPEADLMWRRVPLPEVGLPLSTRQFALGLPHRRPHSQKVESRLWL